MGNCVRWFSLMPTALNKYGRKIVADGFTFDSQKEYDFYSRFIKNCGFRYKVHPSYHLEDLHQLKNGVKLRAIRYTPDIVVYNPDDTLKHVYDVKNSFGAYGIDTGNKLRFNLFARKYGVPVEAVVIRKRDFKSIAQGVTKSRKTGDPYISSTVNYDWIKSTNQYTNIKLY